MKNNNKNESFNERLNLSITPNNSIAFALLNFNLCTVYNELYDFHTSYQLDNKLFFAYPFNKNGLITKRHPISGYIETHRHLSILSSELLSKEDLDFFFDLEYKLDNEYACLYKYNVLNLYVQLKFVLESDVIMEDDLFEFCVGEDSSNFYIFISKDEVSNSNINIMINNFFKDL